MARTIENTKETRGYFVIEGGVLGYMEIEAAKDLAYSKVAQQVKEYNAAQDEMKTGCKMYFKVVECETTVTRFDF